jgi:ADP-heptose:LPS heptosyltransferase
MWLQRALTGVANMILDGFLFAFHGLRATDQTRAAIIRVDAFGDFILWLEAGKEITRQLPGMRIALIANIAWAPYARRLDCWHEVIEIDPEKFTGNLVYRAQKLRMLRAAGFGMAINPTFSRQFFLDDAIVRATAAGSRIGWEADGANILPWQRRIADRWYTRRIRADAAPSMEIERNAEFAEKLFRSDFSARLADLPETTEPAPFRALQRDYFVVAPGSSWNGKRWPPANFARVVAEIRKRTGWAAIFTGTAAEAGVCRQINEASAAKGMVLAGETSIAGLIEVIRSSKAVIANDSASIHIAAATGTPSVCVLGGGQHGRFLPYPMHVSREGAAPITVSRSMPCFGCDWKCTMPHDPDEPRPCVASIEVEDVLRAFDVLLLRPGKHG